MPHKAYFNLPEEKQQRIRKAAVELYGTLPYEQVTARLLAKQAGVSVGSLYQYFADKDEIYVYYLNELSPSMVGLTPEMLIENFNNLSRGEAYRYLTAEENAFVNSMFYAPAEVLEKYYYVLSGSSFEFNRHRVERAIEQGKLPADIDTELFSFLNSGVMFSLVMYGRAKGLDSPESNRRMYYEKFSTIRHFGTLFDYIEWSNEEK
ncbi:MAG: TetR/AcrR family transcriptional regulator [Clostridia bacterium]|nr:TetR/AcrR family transcriptional regulator [Clostridia bacterium]